MFWSISRAAFREIAFKEALDKSIARWKPGNPRRGVSPSNGLCELHGYSCKKCELHEKQRRSCRDRDSEFMLWVYARPHSKERKEAADRIYTMLLEIKEEK